MSPGPLLVVLLAAAGVARAGDLAGPELVPVRPHDAWTGLENRLPGAAPAHGADALRAGTVNRAVLIQSGTGHDAVVEQVGAANVASIRQDGVARKAAVGQYGDGNRADVVQGPHAPNIVVQQYGNQGYTNVIQY